MRPLLAVAGKELRLLLRDPSFLVLQIAFPLLALVVFGTIFSVTVRTVPVAVADLDGGTRARAIVRDLGATGVLRPETADPRRALESGADTAGVYLVRGASGPRVQLLVDGSSGVARPAAAALVDAAAGPALTPVAARTWYNPSRRDALFFVPGVVALVLFAGAAIFPGLALVREKESGCWVGLSAAPIADSAILLGKLLPYLVQLVVLAAVMIAGACLGFGVPFRGAPAVLAGGTLLLLLAGIGFGASIAASSRTENQTWRLIQIFVLLPGFVLSGFIYPISSMPVVAQLLSRLFPVRPYLEVLRGVLLRGATGAELTPQLATLAGFAAVSLAAAVWLVRRSRRAA